MSTLRPKDLSPEDLDTLLADRNRTLTEKQRLALLAERDRRETAQAHCPKCAYWAKRLGLAALVLLFATPAWALPVTPPPVSCCGPLVTVYAPVTISPPITAFVPVSDAPAVEVYGPAWAEDPPVDATPEPGTLLLVGSGFGLLSWFGSRRSR